MGKGWFTLKYICVLSLSDMESSTIMLTDISSMMDSIQTGER